MKVLKSSAHAVFVSTMLVCAGAQAVTDQVNAPSSLSPIEIDSRSPLSTYQQEVRVGVAGVLTQVDLYQSGAYPFQSFRFFINRGFEWQMDPEDFSTTVTNGATGTISVDLSSAGLSFEVGDYFMIGIQGLGPDSTPGGLMFGSEYTPGRLFYNAAVITGTSFDMAFTTSMAPVPEPSSAVMLFGGLIGVMRLVMRRRGANL